MFVRSPACKKPHVRCESPLNWREFLESREYVGIKQALQVKPDGELSGKLSVAGVFARLYHRWFEAFINDMLEEFKREYRIAG
jgi:hypothetical protein